MNRLILISCLLALVSKTEARVYCGFRNLFGVHLDVHKMISEVNVNNDDQISVMEDRNSYSFYDANKDGRVTRFEFVNRLSNEFCYPKTEANHLFDVFDTNNDAILTTNDSNPRMPLFGANGNIPIATMIKRLQRADNLAQQAAHKREVISQLIKLKYDGIGSFFDF